MCWNIILTPGNLRQRYINLLRYVILPKKRCKQVDVKLYSDKHNLQHRKKLYSVWKGASRFFISFYMF